MIDPPPKPGQRVGGRWFSDVDAFVRDYTGGLQARDIVRLFDRDAASIYSVLARDQDLGSEPEDSGARFFHRARVIFLGFSYRLTPARRVLFLASVLMALLGMLDFGFAFDFRGRLVFDSSPLWFVASVAGLIFLLALELVDQVRFRDELEVARQLQAELLPDVTPNLPGFRIRHAYRTANAVGGDYYDFQRLDDGRLALFVGDASGHGIAAGLLMAIANSALKLAIDLDPEPVPVLNVLNRSLVRTGGTKAFMSVFYAILHPDTGELDYAISGHPFPILRRADGTLEELGTGSIPLGLRPGVDIPSGRARLDDGDLLVMYSDGLPEAINRHDEAFGYPRLHSVVKGASTPESAHDAILRALDGHLGERPLTDDFSLVVLGRMTPPPPPPPPPPPTQ